MARVIHSLEQGSEEWHEMRKSKMTASEATCIASRGSGLESYCKKIARQINGEERQHFSNEHTERGHELEPYARLAYEIETGEKVEVPGFITNPEVSEMVGASLDGVVWRRERLVEIKCLAKEKHLKLAKSQKPDSAHYCQMQMQMLVSEINEGDYVLYNPNVEPALVIIPVRLDYAVQERLILGIKKGEQIIKANL